MRKKVDYRLAITQAMQLLAKVGPALPPDSAAAGAYVDSAYLLLGQALGQPSPTHPAPPKVSHKAKAKRPKPIVVAHPPVTPVLPPV